MGCRGVVVASIERVCTNCFDHSRWDCGRGGVPNAKVFTIGATAADFGGVAGAGGVAELR